jgi:hypothetical protein
MALSVSDDCSAGVHADCNGSSPACEFPYRLDNATSRCASAADLLGEAFAIYNLAYIWAIALLLFGFLRSWLFSLREQGWHLVGHPSVAVPLLCTIAQVLAIIDATNLHLLRWSTRIWASLGCELFTPCAFSALLVHFDDARLRPQTLGALRRWCTMLLHALPWCLGLALSVINATTPTFVAEGVSYIYIVPFILILVVDMARVAWTERAASDRPNLQRKLIGLISLLVSVAFYLTVRGISLLVADGRGPSIVAFPFASMPVPVARVLGFSLTLSQYGRPRASDKSQYIDPLTLAAAHVALLSGLMSTGFIVATAEALETVFLTAMTVVPTLFVAALWAQLFRNGPLLGRSEDETAALIAQCKADLSRTWSIPIAVKQFCTGSFLVSLSLKMGPARQDDGGSSAAFRALTVLVEVERLSEWTHDHRRDLSVGVLTTYVVLFGSFVLLRLAPMPRWFLTATLASWVLFYDLLLISAMRFVTKGLKCDGGTLVVDEHVPCDLSYTHRATLWVTFMT